LPEDHWYIVGEYLWRTVGEYFWYIVGEYHWYIIERLVTGSLGEWTLNMPNLTGDT
jgi:hypothetical protein